jgi:hypothetical protein
MAIDLGNFPVGTPPTEEQSEQIRNVLNLASETTVSLYTLSTGSTITANPNTDETIYLDSVTSTPVASITLILPSSTNSHVGQVKLFTSSKTITTLGVSISGGGTLIGNILTSAFPYEVYSYQCISISGAGTWLRLA